MAHVSRGRGGLDRRPVCGKQKGRLCVNSGDILTLREVAKHLRLAERTVYAMVQAREIPAFRIRNQWRFRARRVRGLAGAGLRRRHEPAGHHRAAVRDPRVAGTDCVRRTSTSAVLRRAAEFRAPVRTLSRPDGPRHPG